MVYYKKPGKWAAMTASGIDFAYVYDFFPSRFWNCSNNVVLFFIAVQKPNL